MLRCVNHCHANMKPTYKFNILRAAAACSLLSGVSAQGALILTYDATSLALGAGAGQAWAPTGTAPTAGPTTTLASGTVIDTTSSSSIFTQAISGGNSSNDVTTFNTLANNNDFSYEFWIRPADLLGDHNIFEVGGFTVGTSITIEDDTIQATVRENGTSNTVSHTLSSLPSDFIQVLAVVDMGATNDNATLDDTLTLYIDGMSVSTLTGAFGATVGGNAGNFGNTDTNIGRPDAPFSNPHAAYDGEIALARMYDNALTPAEVLLAFNSTVPEPSSALLLGLSLLGFTARRKR